MQLESYKKKIEEIPDLRNQIKTLESQIDNYVMEKVRSPKFKYGRYLNPTIVILNPTIVILLSSYFRISTFLSLSQLSCSKLNFPHFHYLLDKTCNLSKFTIIDKLKPETRYSWCMFAPRHYVSKIT